MMQPPIFKKRTRSQVYTSKSHFDRQVGQTRKLSCTCDNKTNRDIRSYSRIQNTIKQQKKIKINSLRNFNYNKWFIKPQNRMKKSVPNIRLDKTSDNFYYKQLFNRQYPDPQCPFNIIVNDKIKLFQKIPTNNLGFLDSFKKTQLARKKRVPQLIEMLLKQQQQRKGKEKEKVS